MSAPRLLELVDTRKFRELFITELGWSNPDQQVRTFNIGGQVLTLSQVAGYKGLRVWYSEQLPPRPVQREIDELIGQDSHERLVIFSDDSHQEWRWPRRAQTGGANAKLLVHQHEVGRSDPHLVKQLETIAIDFDREPSLLELLAKMRVAFDTEAETASVEAARLMGALYSELEKSEMPPIGATLLLARLLFLLFGDDTSMWETGRFQRFMSEQTTDAELNRELQLLFDVLDRPEGERTREEYEPFADFRYVNGGLFSAPLNIPPLTAAFRLALISACKFDWAIISPAVFGSMFQTVKDKEARRHGGEHYTTEVNIMKTIGPLFLDDLHDRLSQSWDDRKKLQKFHEHLGSLRFLDPACGCGNFLIVAYRELRAVELELLKRLRELEISEGLSTISSRGQLSFDVTGYIKVTLDHFYGIEIEEWPARIAETAMLLVDHLANQRMEQDFGDAPDRLPIRIAPTIIHGNALEVDWEEMLPASDSTFVFGNPPFVGQKEKEAAQTADMRRVWGRDYDGYLDYVTGWHAKTVAYLRNTTRAAFAFVTTNSITQGQPVGSLFRPIIRDGWGIKFAHRTFAWQSEAAGAAAVHCVIIGFAKGVVAPRMFDYDKPRSAPHEVAVAHINGYLLDGPDTYVDKRMTPASPALPQLNVGSKALDWGRYTISANEYQSVAADPILAKYLRPFIGGKELINGIGRWCLWLNDLDAADLDGSAELRRRVDEVRQLREESDDLAANEASSTPHLFQNDRQPVVDYLGVPNTFAEGRRFMTAARLPSTTIASIKLFTSPDPDGFLFAAISCSMALTWQKMVGGRLKSDPSFSNTLVWNNFPFPKVTPVERENIVIAGDAVLAARHALGRQSLAEMYDPRAMDSGLLASHDQLDEVIDQAFGLGVRPTERDREQCLFESFIALSNANELSIPLSPRRGAAALRRRG